jgi:competence protein ComEC
MIQLAIALFIGILLAYFFPISFSLVFCLVLGIIILFVIWLLTRHKLKPKPFFEVVSLFFFVCIGFVNFQFQQPQFQQNHYSKFYTENQFETIQVKIKEVLKPSPFQDKYIAEVFQLNSQKTEGKILLNIQKDSLQSHLQVDDNLLLYSKIKELRKAANPHQFDYNKYMQHLGVYYQMEGSKNEILDISKGSPTLKGLAEQFRNHLIYQLKETPIESNERSIIEALVLGQRRNIDPEIYKEYAAAGAIHILAVSGLHVGIIFLILSWLLKPISYFKFGNILKSILIVLLLWGFAFLAGLSPSVIRAVTMFSFFALATMTNRPSNSFNVLFLSFFFLLLFNPNWLFYVGFQLSYLAVFFIIWVQPKLSKMYRPRFKIDKLLWDIFTVTLAAQLGIAPLSIYYFHQFPGLFFISNLVILPFLTLLLGYGILVVLLAGIHLLPDFIALGYNYLIKFLNHFIHWIAEKEAFLFRDISISFLQLIGFYLLFISLVIWWKQAQKKWIFSILGSVTFILGITLFEKSIEKEELVIFHKSRKTWMAISSKDSLKIFQKDTFSIENNYPIKGYRIVKNKKDKFVKTVPSVFTFKEKTFVVVDSMGVYPSVNGGIILLSESPKVNLNRLIDSLQPKIIIADGNNYTSYINRWKKTCEKRNIPFHSTREKGAFIVN